MRSRVALALGAGASFAVAACPLAPIRGLTEGDADTRRAPDASILDAGADGAPDVQATPEGGCPGRRESPPALRVPVDGGRFCMDSTEVTRGAYATFLAETGATSAGQPASCEWNTDLRPTANWPPTAETLLLPITNVDWCDAWSFCRWAGKRLCGGRGGGPAPIGGIDDANRDEWYAACSGGGVHAFPYGDSYEPHPCNVSDKGPAPPHPIGSTLDCEGGFEGLFDLTGNVAEWVYTCSAERAGDAGQSDTCLARGGSSSDGQQPQSGRCDTPTRRLIARSGSASDVGFRCCSD